VVRSNWLTKPLQGPITSSDSPSTSHPSASPPSRIIEVVLEDELLDLPPHPSLFDDNYSNNDDDVDSYRGSSGGDEEVERQSDEWDSFEDGKTALPLEEQLWTGGGGLMSASSPSAGELPENKSASSEWGFLQPLGDLHVSQARLWPESLERGEWPADFTLSDHGLVEVVFRVTRFASAPVDAAAVDTDAEAL